MARRKRSKRSSHSNGFPITVIVVLLAIAGAIGALVNGTDMFSQAGPSEQHPAGAILLSLRVQEPGAGIPAYDRDDWRHWVDADRDCQNARHEVLIVESLVPVTYTDERQCSVATGRWIDPYTGMEVTDASALDIDHMVPLANAHRSGAWAWDAAMREAFANDMTYGDHLIAVTASANRAKADKGPDEWRPPAETYWCDYAIDWITIKAEWELTVTPTERDALQEMLATC